MLKPLRLICALIFSFSIIAQSPASKLFVHSLNASNTRNEPAFRQSLYEEQIGIPISFNQTLDFIIPRRRLLDNTNHDNNNNNNTSSDVDDSRKLGESVNSNALVDLASKDNDTFPIETTWILDLFTIFSSTPNNIDSLPSTPKPEEDVTHIRRKRDASMERNHAKYKEEKERNEKIDSKRSSMAEKSGESASTDEQDEPSNVQNSEDGELDDYNAVDESSSADADEPNENEENLEGDTREEAAAQTKDSKMKRESSDYEYVEDQENSADDVNEKKLASDVRVKRHEVESVKRASDDVQLEDSSVNEAKISETGNLETDSKENDSSGKIADGGVATGATENLDSKVAADESTNIKDKELDSKRDVSINKTDSIESSKDAALSATNGKDDVRKAASSETDDAGTDTKCTKTKEDERGTRTASKSNDDYEKRIEEKIKRKIDSIKEEIKREIERKQRDREIERNNAKFDELQSRDSEQEEEESLDGGQSVEEEQSPKRSVEDSKEAQARKRKRRSSENEATRRQLEEIEGVDNLKDEDYRLAGLTHESIQKRFAPVYDKASSNELENKIELSSNKAPIKKREKVRQMFIVKDESKQRRKKRGDTMETKARGRKRKRMVAIGRRVLIPEQARVKIEEELPSDLTLDPRLRRSLPFNKGKQVRTKRENGRLGGSELALEYRPQNIEDEENDEGNEFGDDGFEDRTSNLRDRSANSIASDRSYEEREEEQDGSSVGLQSDPSYRSQTEPLALPAKDSNRRLVTDYNEAFGGLQNLRDNPNGALARFKRIKRVLNPSSSRNSRSRKVRRNA